MWQERQGDGTCLVTSWGWNGIGQQVQESKPNGMEDGRGEKPSSERERLIYHVKPCTGVMFAHAQPHFSLGAVIEKERRASTVMSSSYITAR